MTTAVLKKIRRNYRYSRFELQNNHRVQNGSLQRERMTCSGQLPQEPFQNTQDWVSGVGISPSGRFQVIETAQPRKKLISAEGIRWDLARVLMILLAGLMAAFLLAEIASIGATSIQIRRLEEKIEAVQQKNEALQAELERSAGDVSVCTEAVRLNMISSNGAKTITLTAPQGASMLPVESGAESAQAGGEVRASAAVN